MLELISFSEDSSSYLKITSASTGSSSSITIKSDSGTNAKALFGTGASVTGVALRAGATGTLKTELTGADMVTNFLLRRI